MNFFFCSANLQAIVVEQPAKREKRDDSMSLAKIVATTFLLFQKKKGWARTEEILNDEERLRSLSSSEEWCAKVQLSDRLELNLTSGTIPIL